MYKIPVLLLLSFFYKVSGANVLERFNDWINRFQISFQNDTHLYNVYKKWTANDDFITKTNAQNLTYTLGHNQFSGMDSNDYRKYILLDFKTNMDKLIDMDTFDYVSVPPSVDWVKAGAVTPVKNQGQCGSCWSFSATGALEGAYYNKYGVLESFSEQQLVDCDNLKNGGRDHGCNGGLMDNAFSWIKKNGGLCLEQNYPYVSGTTTVAETCKTTCHNDANSKILSFMDVLPNSDQSMLVALTKQPVSVAIEADQPTFQLYKSGVFTGTCGTNLDHGVLVVGYGTEGTVDYYTVKNSWGETWGTGGYIKLARGPTYNNGSGQCGVLMQASYPVL